MAVKSAARARKARPWDREVGASGVRRVARRAPGRIPAGRSPVSLVRAVAEGGRRVAGSLGPGSDGCRKPRQQKLSRRGGGPPSGCQSPNGRPVRRGTPLESLTSPRPLPSTVKVRTSLAESDGGRPLSWVREDAFLTTTRPPGRGGIRGGIRGPRTEHRLPFGESSRRQWRTGG